MSRASGSHAAHGSERASNTKKPPPSACEGLSALLSDNDLVSEAFLALHRDYSELQDAHNASLKSLSDAQLNASAYTAKLAAVTQERDKLSTIVSALERRCAALEASVEKGTASARARDEAAVAALRERVQADAAAATAAVNAANRRATEASQRAERACERADEACERAAAADAERLTAAGDASSLRRQLHDMASALETHLTAHREVVDDLAAQNLSLRQQLTQVRSSHGVTPHAEDSSSIGVDGGVTSPTHDQGGTGRRTASRWAAATRPRVLRTLESGLPDSTDTTSGSGSDADGGARDGLSGRVGTHQRILSSSLTAALQSLREGDPDTHRAHHQLLVALAEAETRAEVAATSAARAETRAETAEAKARAADTAAASATARLEQMVERVNVEHAALSDEAAECAGLRTRLRAAEAEVTSMRNKAHDEAVARAAAEESAESAERRAEAATLAAKATAAGEADVVRRAREELESAAAARRAAEAAAAAAEAERNSVQRELETAQAAIMAIQTEMDELTDKMHALMQQNADAAVQLLEAENAADEAKERTKELEVTVATLQADLEAEQRIHHQQKVEIEASQARHTARVDAAVAAATAERRAELSEAQTAANAAKADAARQRSLAAAATQRADRAAAQLKVCEDEHAAALAVAKEREAALRVEIAAKAAELHSVRSASLTSPQRASEVAEALVRAETAEARLVEERARADAAQHIASEKASAAAAAAAEVASLQDELAASRAEVHQLQVKLQACAGDKRGVAVVSEMSTAMAELEDSNRSLRAKCAEQSEELKAARLSAMRMESSLAELSGRHADSDASPRPASIPPPSPAQARTPVRVYIGLELSDGVTFRDTDDEGAPKGRHEYGGLRVVAANGPAAVAGLLPMDLLVKVSGVTVTRLDQFARVVSCLRPGEGVPVEVYRGGELITLTLVPSAATMVVRGGLPAASDARTDVHPSVNLPLTGPLQTTKHVVKASMVARAAVTTATRKSVHDTHCSRERAASGPRARSAAAANRKGSVPHGSPSVRSEDGTARRRVGVLRRADGAPVLRTRLRALRRPSRGSSSASASRLSLEVSGEVDHLGASRTSIPRGESVVSLQRGIETSKPRASASRERGEAAASASPAAAPVNVRSSHPRVSISQHSFSSSRHGQGGGGGGVLMKSYHSHTHNLGTRGEDSWRGGGDADESGDGGASFLTGRGTSNQQPLGRRAHTPNLDSSGPRPRQRVVPSGPFGSPITASRVPGSVASTASEDDDGQVVLHAPHVHIPSSALTTGGRLGRLLDAQLSAQSVERSEVGGSDSDR